MREILFREVYIMYNIDYKLFILMCEILKM